MNYNQPILFFEEIWYIQTYLSRNSLKDLQAHSPDSLITIAKNSEEKCIKVKDLNLKDPLA